MMHGPEKSDPAIVAKKPANKAGQPAAERVEQRAGTKGNTGQPRTRRTQSRGSVSPGLDRVRHAARQRKKEKFTALLHHVTVDLLTGCVSGAQAPCCTRSGWRDVAGLRGEPGGQPSGSARASPSRRVSGIACAGGGSYRSRQWRQAAPAGYCCTGRQDRPARDCSRCSTRSMRKTSSASRTGSGPGAVSMMRWTHFRWRSAIPR